jgi:hypothetical protein
MNCAGLGLAIGCPVHCFTSPLEVPDMGLSSHVLGWPWSVLAKVWAGHGMAYVRHALLQSWPGPVVS